MKVISNGLWKEEEKDINEEVLSLNKELKEIKKEEDINDLRDEASQLEFLDALSELERLAEEE